MHFTTLGTLEDSFPYVTSQVVFLFLTLALRSILGLPVYHLSCLYTLLGNHRGSNELMGPIVPVMPHLGTGKPPPCDCQWACRGNRTHVHTAVEPCNLAVDYGGLGSQVVFETILLFVRSFDNLNSLNY